MNIGKPTTVIIALPVDPRRKPARRPAEATPTPAREPAPAKLAPVEPAPVK